MYDLQFNLAFRAPDGSPTHRAKVAKLSGPRAIHSMRYQCCLLRQTIEACDGSSEGEVRLRFSNGDSLTVARDDGPEGFTIHQIGQRLIVG
jgi:hypothetical protein